MEQANTGLIALLILTVVAASAAVGPADAQTKSNDSAQMKAYVLSNGKNAVKMKLKDPKSATFRNLDVHKGADGMYVMCGEVNSKNSFGGYTGFQKFVSVGTPEGTFLQEEVSDFAGVWNRVCR